MPLSWNEIRSRAITFSKEWEDESREEAEAKSFLDDFFDVFGISRRRVATFETNVKKIDGKDGYIDLLWKGQILIEHKSRGKDLDKAFTQAKDYFPGLKDEELPKYILVSDFNRFRLHNLETNEILEFPLKELYKNIKLFSFIAGYQKTEYKEEDPVNAEAAYLMAALHDKMKEVGYEGHALELYLVRLLFCLFADDTTIFEKNSFQDFLLNKTKEDGTDLGAQLAQLFEILNTPPEKRLKNIDDDLNAFQYVNGGLFEEGLHMASFDNKMRRLLLDCCKLNWSLISPAIFGSMFQAVVDPKERRNLGQHYTSEKNILKLIKPLFLDELYKEFESIKRNKIRLLEFHEKISNLKFLDPACGCGNFLVITYRELRILEIEVLKQLYSKQLKKLQLSTEVDSFIKVNVDNFYGIEYEEFPVRIAEVAMWLIDHQMNIRVSEEFGHYYARLPLKKSANITHGNALRINWQAILPNSELNYILGNPPFIGYSVQSKEQKDDVKIISKDVVEIGVLDYVACWYIKASEYILNTEIKVAFVSTNSISQGEQVGVLWNVLFNKYKVKIFFAHRTFVWNNEAKNNAAVHVVIIGFSLLDIDNKIIFDYEGSEEPHELKVKNINPYLVESDNILILRRTKPLCSVPNMTKGSSPTDGGNLLIDLDEYNNIVTKESELKQFIRRYVGSYEFINNIPRYCLWLKDADPNFLKSSPFIMDRLSKVKGFRLNSKKESTKKWADFPTLFIEERQPLQDYIIIPRVSSENRKYIPMGYLQKEIIVSDSAIALINATRFHFGILISEMHMVWTKLTCGRLKSDYRYSNTLVYNNFPWPDNPSEKNVKLVEENAQYVLDVRLEFPDSSLADLYHPIAMPPKLLRAHQELDKAADLCYRPQPFQTELSRIEFLFNLYKKYTVPLLEDGKKKKKKSKKNCIN